MLSLRRHAPEPGAVYVINSIGTPDLKVGESNDPDQRLRDHQTGNPEILELYRVDWFDSKKIAQWVESYAKDLLAPWPSPARNEWFRREPPGIDWAIDEAITAYHGSIARRRVLLPIKWKARTAWRNAQDAVRRVERVFATIGLAAVLWFAYGALTGDPVDVPTPESGVSGATAETGG